MVAVNMKRLIISVTLVLFFILFSGCAEIPTNSPTPTPIITPADEILLSVFVLTDQPTDTMNYELMEGTPTNVGVYIYYLKDPRLAGSGVFEKIDTIPLKKLDNSTFYGEGVISKVNNTLCVGYPSTNYIDSKGCVNIDQSNERMNITVYYWKTTLPPVPSSKIIEGDN